MDPVQGYTLTSGAAAVIKREHRFLIGEDRRVSSGLVLTGWGSSPALAL